MQTLSFVGLVCLLRIPLLFVNSQDDKNSSICLNACACVYFHYCLCLMLIIVFSCSSVNAWWRVVV
jgi:hypothetical protein